MSTGSAFKSGRIQFWIDRFFLDTKQYSTGNHPDFMEKIISYWSKFVRSYVMSKILTEHIFTNRYFSDGHIFVISKKIGTD